MTTPFPAALAARHAGQAAHSELDAYHAREQIAAVDAGEA